MKPAYSDLLLQTGAIKSGIVSVQVAPREWLTGDPVIDFSTGKVKTPVTFIEGTNWMTLEFTQPSYDYDEEYKSNKSGSYYEVTISGTLNTYDALAQQVVDSIRYHELVAIVTDRNKKMKLAGDTNSGLVLSVSNRTQNNNGGQQTVQLKLLMDSEAPPPFYEL